MRKIFSMFAAAIILTIFTSNAQMVTASYYADKFHGRKTASGTIYNMYEMTCAHKTLPFGTMLKVRNPKNNKVVLVKVTDRGPFIKGRSIDLSYAAAKELEMLSRGVIQVEMWEHIPES